MGNMDFTNNSSWRKSLAMGTAWLALLTVAPPGAQAVDGRIMVQGTRQDGGAGSTAYETSTLLENYSLGQRHNFPGNLVFQIDFITRRQTLESRSPLGNTDSEIVSLLPNASLTYRSHGLRAGLLARALRKDTFGSGNTAWRDENADFGAWVRREWSWLDLDAKIQETTSRREADLDDRDNREHNQAAGLAIRPTDEDELRYRFSRNVQELRLSGTELTFQGHNLQYRGGREFMDGRGRVSLDARGSYLKQISSFRGEGGLDYAAPIWGGFSLDGTPELQDILEPEPVPVAALYDLDRDAVTEINLGDSGSVVRQFGGDYRNLIFDFGDTEQVDQVVIYVDTVLRFPALMQWRFFTSDDPEGRDWSNELDAGQFSAVWFELADGRQGWRVDLTTTLAHRRIKLVNTKLGLTEPDIRVTEMEAYRLFESGQPDQEQNVRRHRLQGDLSYDLTEALQLQYSTNLTGRHFDESDRDVNGSAHRFGANLQLSRWRLAASHELNRVRNSTGQDTDANSQFVSLSNTAGRVLRTRLSWSRAEDRSWTLQNLTHTAAGEVTWQAAPRLTINQKVAYGIRDAISLGVESRSWTMSTTIRGRPRPSLEIQLRRDDRWVSEEAGADFSSFNNTELQSTWALRPLLTLTSQILYQVRQDDDIMARNTLTWIPLPGGSVGLRLSAHDLQDTRTDWFQRGAGGTVTWRPRPRLYLESGIEWVLVKQADERNTPTNLQFRGSWTF